MYIVQRYDVEIEKVIKVEMPKNAKVLKFCLDKWDINKLTIFALIDTEKEIKEASFLMVKTGMPLETKDRYIYDMVYRDTLIDDCLNRTYHIYEI